MKNDPTFYAVIATVRPDLLDNDDIKMIGKALLDQMPVRDRARPKLNGDALSTVLAGNGSAPVKRRRRRKGAKRAKRARRHVAAVAG